MNSKKILMIIIAVVIVAIIGVLAWKGIRNKTGSNSTVPTTENPITTDTIANGADGQTTTGDIGKVTLDIFVEITAQTAYHTAAKDIEQWALSGDAGKLFQEYSVTDENLTAFATKLQNDPKLMQEFMQKYQLRLTELQDTGK
jgi:uncharacterized protein YxeA